MHESYWKTHKEKKSQIKIKRVNEMELQLDGLVTNYSVTQ
jgi:hypothetical protein